MLEVRDITFRYRKGQPVIECLSLAVGPDERVAVVAPSGTGKTTLCRLLAGCERPTEGEVFIDGKPLSLKGVCPVQMVGQHPEHAFDPQLTIATSLKEATATCARAQGNLPSPMAEGILRELMERFGVQERWLARYPRELSGGELQRLCLVRALAVEPRYLVADEMTAMLDAITQAQIWHELLDEAAIRNMGILLVSHSPSLTAHVATRIVQLDDAG